MTEKSVVWVPGDGAYEYDDPLLAQAIAATLGCAWTMPERIDEVSESDADGGWWVRAGESPEPCRTCGTLTLRREGQWDDGDCESGPMSKEWAECGECAEKARAEYERWAAAADAFYAEQEGSC